VRLCAQEKLKNKRKKEVLPIYSTYFLSFDSHIVATTSSLQFSFCCRSLLPSSLFLRYVGQCSLSFRCWGLRGLQFLFARSFPPFAEYVCLSRHSCFLSFLLRCLFLRRGVFFCVGALQCAEQRGLNTFVAPTTQGNAVTVSREGATCENFHLVSLLWVSFWSSWKL